MWLPRTGTHPRPSVCQGEVTLFGPRTVPKITASEPVRDDACPNGCVAEWNEDQMTGAPEVVLHVTNEAQMEETQVLHTETG
jgi:hypothetical protein